MFAKDASTFQYSVFDVVLMRKMWVDIIAPSYLQITVDWVECKRRKGCRVNERVVGLVDVFINEAMMQSSMHPVDHGIRKY